MILNTSLCSRNQLRLQKTIMRKRNLLLSPNPTLLQLPKNQKLRQRRKAPIKSPIQKPSDKKRKAPISKSPDKHLRTPTKRSPTGLSIPSSLGSQRSSLTTSPFGSDLSSGESFSSDDSMFEVTRAQKKKRGKLATPQKVADRGQVPKSDSAPHLPSGDQPEVPMAADSKGEVLTNGIHADKPEEALPERKRTLSNSSEESINHNKLGSQYQRRRAVLGSDDE